MNRRTLLAATLCAALVPATAISGENMVEYEPGLVETALADGKTVLLDYSASWCSTCRRQARVINELRADNPDYDASMVFVRVDWDTYSSHEISVFHNIPRRSTLLLLRGDDELGRIVAGTAKGKIQELMDKGLQQPS